jgi:catechol 2,3-dioxygenase-like lactoylglutathione lyase family enzyme
MQRPKTVPGNNIALKIPPHEFEETIAFYRDVLGLRSLGNVRGSVGFDFDGKSIWIDRVEALSHAEIWLELRADDVSEAEAYFEEQGIIRRDEIEKLPDDFSGFWVSTNSDLIHLVSGNQSNSE